MVLNVANRDPGTLGVMAATLQEVSEGRLLLGLDQSLLHFESLGEQALGIEPLGHRHPSERRLCVR